MSGHDHLGAEHYRSLFEGSQASLSDMAARQAQALARVGRLRSAIVAVLRKNFMELSAQAEASLGGRLSEVDDEILLAYLDAFTAAASRGDQRATIQALKEAVMALGVPLRGDEPLVWVEQIHQHRQHVQHAAPPRRAEPGQDDTSSVDAAGPSEATQRPPLLTTGPAPDAGRPIATNQPLPLEDYWKWDEATPLSDLFDDFDHTAQHEAHDGGAGDRGHGTHIDTPQRWKNELGTLAPDEERWTPSPIAPGSAPRTGPAPAPAVAPEPGEVITASAPDAAERARPTTGEPVADPSSPGADAASDERPATSTDTGTEAPPKPARRQPRRKATAPSAESTPSQPAENADAPATGISSTSTTDATSGGEDDLSSLFDDTSPSTPDAPIVDAPIVDAPMRPELFAPTPAKRRRGTRTKANPPVEALTLAEGVAPLELNDGMRRALLAAAAIPRPVFTRDLIGVAGSLAMVDAWEAECRADVSSSPVRFVAPKSRHRLRGHLVAVEPSNVRPGDWWYQAVQRYRAGRLYELGVLLHRVGDEIVSFTLEDQLAVFRLNTPRGLVGMIVMLDPRPVTGGASSSDLADHIENLLAERLTMIAVLTASAEPGSLENVIAHMEGLARQRQWQPTAPVIAARSWEYADDRGTSAVMVLGQN